MTAYDETRCYAPVGGTEAGPMYCGSPAKRKDNYGRPLCGRCVDRPGLLWWEHRVYPEGPRGNWKFKRNPPAPKPLPATVAHVTKVLKAAGIGLHSPATRSAGLYVRRSYGNLAVAIDYRQRDGQWIPDNEVAGVFAKARDALAARGLTLVMVDDRHATVTETKP